MQTVMGEEDDTYKNLPDLFYHLLCHFFLFKEVNMTYKIVTFYGDYPVEHQKYWDKEYEKLSYAVADATEQHHLMKEEYFDNHYTVIMEDEDIVFLMYKGTAYLDNAAQKKADELGGD